MTPYDPKAKCPECGGKQTEAFYIPREHPKESRRRRECFCHTCNHRWPESPLDTKEKK